MNRILIIEDEVKITEILTEFLLEYGYAVDNAYDGIEGLDMFKNNKYDLILLDIMMPKIDGFAVLEIIRRDSNIPIIMITAIEDEESQMKGFDLLVDDYIVKPFSMNLVIRRIEAVLRRMHSQNEHVQNEQIKNEHIQNEYIQNVQKQNVYTRCVRTQNEKVSDEHILIHKKIILDVKACEVRLSGNTIPFTYKEYELLKLLLENKNRVFTRDDLLRIVWGYDFIGDDKVVNNHIMRIRKKLGEDLITTVRGMGYKINE